MSKYHHVCQWCGNSFANYQKAQIFCNRQCKAASQRHPFDKERALELYESGLSQKQVAETLGVSRNVIEEWFVLLRDTEGYECRKGNGKPQHGENNHMWKGGRRIETKGYVLLYKPEHPRSVRGYVPEHILVAEQAIGRFLNFVEPGHSENEVVHHINGERDNNQTYNLVVLQHGDHISLHNRNKSQRQVIDYDSGQLLGKVTECAKSFGITPETLLTHIHLGWLWKGRRLVLPNRENKIVLELPNYRVLTSSN